MNKKNTSNIVVISIVIILIVASIVAYSKNRNEAKIRQQSINQVDNGIKNALQSDTTESINNNLNNINIEDTTDTDLQTVDQELQKL